MKILWNVLHVSKDLCGLKLLVVWRMITINLNLVANIMLIILVQYVVKDITLILIFVTNVLTVV